MRDVVGFEGLYKVTSCGKIWGVKREKFLSPAGGKGNYQMVCLSKNGKHTYDYVHRIVAKAYIPNPNNYPEVNHMDEVKDHNWYMNLEWCTSEYNKEYTCGYRFRAKPVECVETGEVFPSINNAAKVKKVDVANLSSMLKYEKTHYTLGGFHWRYAS
jgi:hypothetical protein